MSSSLYLLASGLFVALTLGLALLFIRGVRYSLSRQGYTQGTVQRATWRTALGLAAWLGYLAFLARTGVLHAFDELPPRFLVLVFLPALLGMVLLFASGWGRRVAQGLPGSWLIGLQAFRVLMEVILWLVFLAGVIPVQMTFEGLNWDILPGLTAPLVAYFVYVRRSWPAWVGIAWNFVGLAVLLNIIVVSTLSSPVPFRVFFNEPANTFIADFPFVWLPGFVVTMALLLHLVSLRQLFRQAPARQDDRMSALAAG